jgi:hypothetical protein
MSLPLGESWHLEVSCTYYFYNILYYYLSRFNDPISEYSCHVILKITLLHTGSQSISLCYTTSLTNLHQLLECYCRQRCDNFRIQRLQRMGYQELTK